MHLKIGLKIDTCHSKNRMRIQITIYRDTLTLKIGLKIEPGITLKIELKIAR